jgi:hypothetical protein
VNRGASQRGVALVVALMLLVLASGLLAIVGLTGKQLVQLDQVESDRATLRQMIDSGAAWARRHADDWPTTAGRLGCPQLDVDGIVPRACRGVITLRPESTNPAGLERVRIEARLDHAGGRYATRATVVLLSVGP